MVLSLGSYLGVIGAWFRAFGRPKPSETALGTPKPSYCTTTCTTTVLLLYYCTSTVLLLYYYCTIAVLLYSTRPQTWAIVEGSVGFFSLGSYFGVIVAWLRAFW